MDKTLLIYFLSSTQIIEKSMAEEIANTFDYKVLSKGDLFLKHGQISNEYLFLETGFVRSFVYDLEGNEVTLNFYSERQPVFEVASFFQRIPSQEYFEATTDSKGWVLTYEKLNHLFHTLPQFREFGRSILVKGFIDFKIRTLSLINKTAEERYEMLIASKPEIFQHASLKHIASYLGITDTSLSRIRKNFTKNHFLSNGKISEN